MTQAEKEQLHGMIDRLKAIQEHAPSTVTYKRGASVASISYQLLDVIRDLSEVSDYATEEPETTEA